MPTDQHITFYEDIDWDLLWQNSRGQKSWRSKGAKEWDKKAAGFTSRNLKSPYASLFVDLLDLDSEQSVLDAGCGPGTLALPIAEKASSVTAIDYSQGMLDQLQAEAASRKIENIRTLLCAWEDDWETMGVGIHDIAIASRSMNISDLADGIRKLDRHARKQVIIADRIAPSPFDPDAFTAIGREFSSGPDYIYTLNILYSMNIHPTVNHIELPSILRYASLEEAVLAYAWMFKDLDTREEAALEAFLQSRIIEQGDDYLMIRRRYPQRWVFISWLKNPDEAASATAPRDRNGN